MTGRRRREPSLEHGASRSQIRDELEFYIEERAKEFEAEGMSPEDARAAAEAAFGDVDGIENRVAAEARASATSETGYGGWMMETWWQDIRFAFRGLRKSPGFTLVALLTLALGIGANTGIYSVIDGVFLRKPVVQNPTSLVNVYTTCRRGDPRCSSSYPDYLDYREASGLEDLAATSWTSLNVADPGRPAFLLTGMLVTGNYFELLGLTPAMGRLLRPDDDIVGAPASVAVLAWDTWRTDFAGDPQIVGRTVRLNGATTEIIGVAPEGFNGTGLTDDPDLFMPITTVGGVFQDAGRQVENTDVPPPGGPLGIRGARWMDKLVGRMAPGTSLPALQSEMDALSESLRELDPDARGPRNITTESAARLSLPQFGREDLTRFVLLLGTVVGFTLLLACANVANLLLARASTRQREIGIRKAIGASRTRIIRQLTIESVVLSVLGGVAGLIVAAGVVNVLSTAALPGGVSLAELGVGLDGKVLGFAFGLSLLTGLLFGFAPALRAGAIGLSAVLKGEGGARSRGGNKLRKSLIAIQVGLCLTLVAGSAFFLQTLRNGLTRDLGFDPENLAAVRFSLASLDYGEEEGLIALDRMVERIEALPGVSSASYSSRIPFQIGGGQGVFASVEGYDPAPDEEMRVEIMMAGPRILQTLGVPIVEGIPVGRTDGLPQVWINQVMVDRYFQGRSPIGSTIHLNGEQTVVAGVTADVDWDDVAEENINNLFYSPGLRDIVSRSPVTIAIRGQGDLNALLDEAQAEIQDVAPGVAFMYAQTSTEMVGAALSTQRLAASLLTAFGVLAMTLAAIGIGGVVGYLVNQRKRDIGLRLALGASSGRVIKELISEIAVPIVIGSAIGLGIATRLSGSIDGFLVDASSRDPAPYVISAALLLTVAIVAALLPARATTRIEPMESLRRE